METLTKFPEGTCYVVYTRQYLMRVRNGGYDCYIDLSRGSANYTPPSPDGRVHVLEPKDCVLATQEQVDWIEACIEAKKFVPKEDSNLVFQMKTKQGSFVEMVRGPIGRLAWTGGTIQILGMLKDDSVIVPPAKFSHIKTLGALKSFVNANTNSK